MMVKEDFYIPSTDGHNNLHVIVWKPEGNIKGVIQISHGMIEHIERYDEFACFMVGRGFAVIGNDHLGHGKTAAKSEDLGYFGSGQNVTVVEDLYEVTKYAKEMFGSTVPYFLLGHSMGSFLARQYIMTYNDAVSGAVISGTGYTPSPVLFFGRFLTGIVKSIKGERNHPKLIETIAFSGYNKRIENKRTKSDWLSKDEKLVDIYCNDPFCSFTFSVDGYQTLFGSLDFIQNSDNYKKISCNLPILFISGTEDPVGNYSKGVIKVYNQYKEMGVADITMKLYEGDRHEVLNETNRQEAYSYISQWIESRA